MFAADYQKRIWDFWETRIIRATRFRADKQVHTTLTLHKNFQSTAIINVSEDGPVQETETSEWIQNNNLDERNTIL